MPCNILWRSNYFHVKEFLSSSMVGLFSNPQLTLSIFSVASLKPSKLVKSRACSSKNLLKKKRHFFLFLAWFLLARNFMSLWIWQVWSSQCWEDFYLDPPSSCQKSYSTENFFHNLPTLSFSRSPYYNPKPLLWRRKQ